jgi:hypothetical protein
MTTQEDAKKRANVLLQGEIKILKIYQAKSKAIISIIA